MLLRQDAPDAGGIDAAAAGGEACSTRCGGIPAACPPTFCCPFPTGTATIIREQMRVPILAGIASQVTPSVVPVWLTWFNGGSGMLNFTGASARTSPADPTTASVSSLLARDVAANVDADAAADARRDRHARRAGLAAAGAPVRLRDRPDRARWRPTATRC